MKPKIASSISAHIFNMQDRDHIAVSYSNSEQMDEIVINFTLRGMASNQINFWIVQQNEKDHWFEILKKKGIDVDQLIDSHELIIMDHKEVISNDSSLISFDPIFKNLQKIKNLVIEKQKFGINIIGTLAGNLYSRGEFSDSIEVAKYWHKIIESFESPITVLCPFYSMTEDHQSKLLKLHNIGVLTLKDNSDIKRTLGNKEINKEESNKYQNLESDIFPKKELAIFNSLNEIISIMREKEIYQKNKIVAKDKKDIPEWYFNLIESLNNLYGNGYDNAHKENENLR